MTRLVCSLLLALGPLLSRSAAAEHEPATVSAPVEHEPTAHALAAAAIEPSDESAHLPAAEPPAEPHPTATPPSPAKTSWPTSSLDPELLKQLTPPREALPPTEHPAEHPAVDSAHPFPAVVHDEPVEPAPAPIVAFSPHVADAPATAAAEHHVPPDAHASPAPAPSAHSESPAAPAIADAHNAPAPRPSPAAENHDAPEAQGHPIDGISTAPENPTHLTGVPIDSLMRLGESQFGAADYEGAITAFYQVLEAHAPPEIEVNALINLSRCYRKLNERTRAVAILERVIKDHPSAPEIAGALLDAGRLHRSLGADKLAISRFYAVLQATLKIPDAKWRDLYRQLARTAQYEIAETHLQAGRYAEAERYFTRFSLLELAPEDRARGAFKVIEARAAADHHEAVVAGAKEFVDQFPADSHVPAALHFATTSLRELGRNDEALALTLQLLQTTEEQQTADPAAWAYWQRRTGNELANTFFQRGDFADARQIYDTLAALDADREWGAPASYQAALCRERLGQTAQAIDIYHDIIAGAKPDDSVGLREIADMARWRMTHLEEIDRERSAVRDLINSLPPVTASNP